MGTWTRIAIFISWICAAISDEMVYNFLFRSKKAFLFFCFLKLNNPERDILRLSKRGLLRLSKKDLGEGPMVYDPERKRGLLRLSKRDGTRNRTTRDTILQLPQLLHLQQRSLRLSKRSDNDSLRLSRRSDTSHQDHKMVIRLSKRQLVNLVSLKRTLSSIV